MKKRTYGTLSKELPSLHPSQNTQTCTLNRGVSHSREVSYTTLELIFAALEQQLSKQNDILNNCHTSSLDKFSSCSHILL